MIKFKGRLAFRQYMPAKPMKWGIKVWAMCESKTGYFQCFQVYTGREGGQEKGLTHRVVTDLTQHLHGTFCKVFMDNYYSSPLLFSDLLANGIYACRHRVTQAGGQI